MNGDQVTPANQAEQPLGPSALRFEMSLTIGKLIGALAKARKQFTPIIKANENPFFKSKYADLADVIEATKDGLSANGLAVMQFLAWESLSGLTIVNTMLAHESGEWIRGILELPTAKRDAQGIGSSSTYGRRYSYSAVLNVASESDDDANAAVSKDFKRKEESTEDFDQRTEGQQTIAAFQITAIDEACKRTGKTEAEVVAYLGLIGHKRIEHLFKSEFPKFLEWANSKGKPAVKPVHAKGPSPEDQVRMQANKKLWAIAAEKGIPEDDVKQAAYEQYSVKSMTELNAVQFDALGKWFKDQV